MTRGANLERVTRLQSAMKRAGADDKLSHTELAQLWGISKGAFTNLRNRVDGFPDGEEGPRNSLLYPAKAALKALFEYETRADQAEQERQKRAAEILGMDRGRGRRKRDEIILPPSEMLKLSRLRGEIEQREREQGEYIHRDKVRGVGARIYGVLNDALSRLEERVDPNGLLPAEQRARIGELGRTALVAIHADLSETLGIDADDGPSRAEGTARPPRRVKRAPARRKR